MYFKIIYRWFLCKVKFKKHCLRELDFPIDFHLLFYILAPVFCWSQGWWPLCFRFVLFPHYIVCSSRACYVCLTSARALLYLVFSNHWLYLVNWWIWWIKNWESKKQKQEHFCFCPSRYPSSLCSSFLCSVLRDEWQHKQCWFPSLLTPINFGRLEDSLPYIFHTGEFVLGSS